MKAYLGFAISQIDPGMRGKRLPESAWSFLNESQPADTTEDA